MSTPQIEEKKKRALSALDQGLTQVHLDARRPGVSVPDAYLKDHHLVLNLSYRFDPPDLVVNDWGLRQTLSFRGSRFTVAIPWSAVYAVASLVTREFWMYPDDVPEELNHGVEKVGPADLLGEPASAPPPRPRPALHEVVMEPAEEEEPAQGDGGPSDPSPPRRGHLRIVK